MSTFRRLNRGLVVSRLLPPSFELPSCREHAVQPELRPDNCIPAAGVRRSVGRQPLFADRRVLDHCIARRCPTVAGFMYVTLASLAAGVTVRTFMRRFSRLALAFSRKFQFLSAAIAGFVAYCNFCWRTRFGNNSEQPGRMHQKESALLRLGPRSRVVSARPRLSYRTLSQLTPSLATRFQA